MAILDSFWAIFIIAILDSFWIVNSILGNLWLFWGFWPYFGQFWFWLFWTFWGFINPILGNFDYDYFRLFLCFDPLLDNSDYGYFGLFGGFLTLFWAIWLWLFWTIFGSHPYFGQFWLFMSILDFFLVFNHILGNFDYGYFGLFWGF